MAGGTYILAHDVGTSGNKAVLVDLDGRLVAKAVQPYRVSYPRPGWAEQDPEDWWGAVARTTREVLGRSGVAPEEVACLTWSYQLLGIVPMSRRGEVIRPAILWLDSRAEEEARKAMRKLGGPRIFRLLAGATITGKDGIPKLLWLKRQEPETYRAMDFFLDVGGYLVWRATGRAVMDLTGASAFGLDLKKKTWLRGFMSYLGLDTSKLPPLVRSVEVVGGLTREAASDLGLKEGTPVVAGAGDVPSASVGAGAVGEGEGHLYLGTSAWLAVVTSRTPRGKHGVVAIQSADPSMNLLLAEMETAGACVERVAGELYRHEAGSGGREAAFEAMNAEAEKAPPGSAGLIFLPWMYGERSPISDSLLRAAFVNLSLDHGREHLARSVYEGISFNIRWALEVVEGGFGVRLPSLRVIGGGALSRPWMQILADVTNRPVEVVQEPQEAGAVGAALTAAVGIGAHPGFPHLRNLVRIAARYEPLPGREGLYDGPYRAFKDLYAALRGIYHRLNRPG